MKPILILTTLIIAACCARGQGTFLVDQSINPTNAPGGFANIQPDPTGESFIPTLSSVGFVEFYLGDPIRVQGPTMSVDLWSGSLGSGTLLGQSSPVSLPTTFVGIVAFSFANPISVTSGTTYYLQPVIQTGDSEQIGEVPGTAYPNGMAFISGTAQPGADLWFREGIIVPEPSCFSLALLGILAIYPVLWNRRRLKFADIEFRNHQKEPCSAPRFATANSTPLGNHLRPDWEYNLIFH